MGRKLLRVISTIFDKTITYLAYFSCVLWAGVVCIVAVDVFLRYFLNRPLVWGITVVEIILATVTFLAAAWLLKEEAHVSLDAVVSRLKPRARAAVMTITSIMCAIACGIICWYGFFVTLYHFELGSILVQKTLYIPKAPLLTVVPIGLFLFTIQFLRRAYKFLQIWRGVAEEERRVSSALTL